MTRYVSEAVDEPPTAVLESAGLVVTERRGRSKFHYFRGDPLAAITRRWPVVGKGTTP